MTWENPSHVPLGPPPKCLAGQRSFNFADLTGCGLFGPMNRWYGDKSPALLHTLQAPEGLT